MTGDKYRCRYCGRTLKDSPGRTHPECLAREKARSAVARWLGLASRPPPPEVDPQREARLLLYQERAASKLPLFGEGQP